MRWYFKVKRFEKKTKQKTSKKNKNKETVNYVTDMKLNPFFFKFKNKKINEKSTEFST